MEGRAQSKKWIKGAKTKLQIMHFISSKNLKERRRSALQCIADFSRSRALSAFQANEGL